VTNPPELPRLPPLGQGGQGADSANQRRNFARQIQRQQRQMIEDLRGWWLQRMVDTPRPLQEKMTLFWHGHFATQSQKIRSPQLMLEQNDLFRRYAAGNFQTLTLEVSRNPAMLRYLDNNTNRKEHPNENYARELMELFTIGIGNYTEQDIKEAARAFTGWTFGIPGIPGGGGGLGFGILVGGNGRRVQPQPIFMFRRQFHDDDEKQFLGRKGNFDGEDVVNIIFEQPATAKFLCGKLYTFFVSDEPAPAGVVEAMADLLRESKYELKPVLEALFRSEEFYRPEVIGGQIKSPVQLVAEAMKQLNAKIDPPSILTFLTRQMGQVLLDPPNVKGWDGGQAWINTTTLLARYNFANFLVNGAPLGGPGRRPGGGGGMGGFFGFRAPRPEPHVDVKALVPMDMRRNPEQIVDQLAERLLAVPLAADQRADLVSYMKKPADDPLAQVRGLIHLIMSSPNYQLC
jgi:uncharacterized protein (DUF1800 family)